MQLKDCKAGDRVEFWVSLNQNGDLSLSPTPTDFTNVGVAIFFDTDGTVLVGWHTNDRFPMEAKQADTFINPKIKPLLVDFAQAAWVQNYAEISRVLPGLGMVCSGRYCNAFNEYAAANQPDGTYLCWSCRQRPPSLR